MGRYGTHFQRVVCKHGMIVAFDDYFCCSATQISGERRAFVEFVAALRRRRMGRHAGCVARPLWLG
jgi:hypothetical protein